MSAPPRLGEGDRLVLASHNAGKLAEFAALFAPYGVELVSAGALGLPEPDETGTTFEENAAIKARAAARGSGLLALSDDSGLCVDALGGKPGVFTANWGGPMRDFGLGMRRLEDALQAANLTSPAERRARFVATFCLADPSGAEWFFTGEVEGTIVWPPRGTSGHGFDPAFMPVGYDATFAQMQPETKNAISHRARAFEKLVAAVCEAPA